THLVTRVGVGLEPDGSVVVRVRDGADGDWRLLLTLPAEDALTSGPIAVSPDGASMLAVSSLGADPGRLGRGDPAGGRGAGSRGGLGSGAEAVIAEDPDADVSGVRVHPDTREPQVVTWVKERTEYRVLDPALDADVAAIRALHPGDPDIVAQDHSDMVWLVAFTNDTGPIPYFFYDRERREGPFLFDHQPELSRYELAPMEPFSFQARGGLTIPGYVTFPPGAGRTGLPMVLNVHGGPWARDAWGFDPEAQWLANRGYLCVQVNFRGS